MKENLLKEFIKGYDYFIHKVDFGNLPDRQSEAYRELLMKTANDEVFCNGRYSQITEYLLETLDEKEVYNQLHNLAAIHALTEDMRIRFAFYVDLADMCYPLFRGKNVGWSAWPWNMKSDSTSMENDELFDFLTDCQWPNLAAAVLYDVFQHIWLDEEHFYSPVSQQEASNKFEYGVKRLWEKQEKTEAELKLLSAEVNKCANDFWFIENHIHVGLQLGFDWVAQSVYDALDTYVDNTYRHKQVDFARELGDWINANMTIGESHPAKEIIEAFRLKFKELLEKYQVSSPDVDYTWNLITSDVLGISVFEDETQETEDAWNDESILEKEQL